MYASLVLLNSDSKMQKRGLVVTSVKEHVPMDLKFKIQPNGDQYQF
jgi:hypothetical protein